MTKMLIFLQVLSLESTAGLESVRCMSRMDLKLDGSFADMILIPDTGVPDKSRTSALFILTNPGQLNFYADGSLFSVQNTKEGNDLPEAQKFPVAVPTIDPNITVTNLCSLTERELSNISLKVHSSWIWIFYSIKSSRQRHYLLKTIFL
jgi:syntaxin-binding protein 5